MIGEHHSTIEIWEKITGRKAPYKDLSIRNNDWHGKKAQWVIKCLQLVESKLPELEKEYKIHDAKFNGWFFEDKTGTS